MVSHTYATLSTEGKNERNFHSLTGVLPHIILYVGMDMREGKGIEFAGFGGEFVFPSSLSLIRM
jgi:hypothetical protein